MTSSAAAISALADELTRVVDESVSALRRLDEAIVSRKPSPDVWSVKEIIGHLVDSAANNHQRFVRAQQVTELALPGYAQDEWVRMQGYQEQSWSALLEFWRLYNHHLAGVMRRAPVEALAVPCRIGSDDPVTLDHLLHDYLRHLRHHLRQIDERLQLR